MGQKHATIANIQRDFMAHLRGRDYPGYYPEKLKESLRDPSLIDKEFSREEYIAILCRFMPDKNWADELKSMNLNQVRLFVRFVVFDPQAPTLCRETPLVGSAYDSYQALVDDYFRRKDTFAQEEFDKVRYREMHAGQKRSRDEDVVEILSSEDETEDNMECEICSEDMCRADTYPAALPCGHVFCHACISRLVIKTCPECRRPYTNDQVRRLYICKNA